MRCRGSENVPAVKGLARRQPPVLLPRELDGIDGPAIVEDEAQEAVVGTDIALSSGSKRQGTSRAPHARIDHGEMDGAEGEESRGGLEAKRPFQHVLGGDVVAYVHEASFGTDAEDDPLHDAHPGISHSEIRGEGDDRRAHDPLGTLGVALHHVVGDEEERLLVGAVGESVEGLLGAPCVALGTP